MAAKKNRPPGGFKRKEDNIKMNLRKTELDFKHWIHLA
jgi:hypothetical protein